MEAFIDYFNFVLSKIVSILDSLKIGNSSSLLFYLLSAIIIGFIFRIVKGGTTEFEATTNFFNGQFNSSVVNHYRMKHQERQEQIVRDQQKARFHSYTPEQIKAYNSFNDIFDKRTRQTYYDNGYTKKDIDDMRNWFVSNADNPKFQRPFIDMMERNGYK